MQELLKKLQEIKGNPSELSKFHLEIAYRYASLSTEYEKKLVEIAKIKKLLWEEYQTISKGDRFFETTDMGIWEKQCKIRLKSYEKILSAIKRRLETLSDESKNQY